MTTPSIQYRDSKYKNKKSATDAKDFAKNENIVQMIYCESKLNKSPTSSITKTNKRCSTVFVDAEKRKKFPTETLVSKFDDKKMLQDSSM